MTFRLLVAQYPHLCIIEDWLEETVMGKTSLCMTDAAEKSCTVSQFKEGNAAVLIILTPSHQVSKIVCANKTKVPLFFAYAKFRFSYDRGSISHDSLSM